MKQGHAFRTASEALLNARKALKPAIVDLGSTDEDFFFEQLIKQYLALGTQERRFNKLAYEFEDRANRTSEY